MSCQLVWTSTFRWAFKRFVRKYPDLLKHLQEKLELLCEDPFHPSLHAHKLTGSLKGVWACVLRDDLCLLFEFR